jgi:hypothetical protein
MDAQAAAVARVAAKSRQFWEDLETAAVGLGPDEDRPTPMGHIPHPGDSCRAVGCPGVDGYRTGDWGDLYGDVGDDEDNGPCDFAWEGEWPGVDGPVLVCQTHGQKSPCEHSPEFDAYEREWPHRPFDVSDYPPKRV